jgi:hypothetical protein
MLLAALMAMAMQAPAAGGAAATAAPGTLEIFKSLCIATEGKGDDAIRRADALNWAAPPRDKWPPIPAALSTMQNIQVRIERPAAEGGAGYALLTGNGADILKTGTAPANAMCFIMGRGVGPADRNLKADVQAWMGNQTPVPGGTTLIYAYTEKNAVRTFLTKDDEVRAALSKGNLKVVAFESDGSTTIMMYIVPTQAN